MEVFEPGFGGISPDLKEIYRGMGYGDAEPDEGIRRYVAEMLGRIAGVCDPCFGYEIMPVERIGRRDISVGGRTIVTGSVITPFFRKAEYVALFVATAGCRFDGWLHALKADGDIMEEFVADAIGSEIAEATARKMSAQLAGRMAENGMKIGNSYSPGYCGWHVDQQQELFALLPPDPCGVSLSASSLMSPIKSVSGLIAIGPEVEMTPYGCALCGRADCYKNRLKQKNRTES